MILYKSNDTNQENAKIKYQLSFWGTKTIFFQLFCYHVLDQVYTKA